jgi:hypothetical protein
VNADKRMALADHTETAIGFPKRGIDALGSAGMAMGWISPQYVLSSATGVVLCVAGGLGGASPNAATVIPRVDVKFAADTAPLEFPRYVVSRDRAESARQVVCEAIRRYRQLDGYEGYLVDAAWQLEQGGIDAWPVLCELAFSQAPEVEYFIGAIVRMTGIEPKKRLAVLRTAARNPDPNVRARLLELIDEMSDGHQALVLRALANSNNPEDDVTHRARFRLTNHIS